MKVSVHKMEKKTKILSIFFGILIPIGLCLFYGFAYKEQNETTVKTESKPKIKRVLVEKVDDVIKPKFDEKSYRGLQLANGLKALLISDSKTDQAVITLTIGVGWIHGPRHVPGLAHLLEHALFLGTWKYSNVNEFKNFISQHGGNCNAATWEHRTSFFYTVAIDSLADSLDRFSQFFISPLFDAESLDGEMDVVHSEFEQLSENDEFRTTLVKQATSSDDHDYNIFMIGNKETFKITPKLKEINVREELIKFYDEKYSSNIMGLTILGKDNLDELEAMVLDSFDEIKNRNITIPIYDRGPVTEKELRKILYIVPKQKLSRLELDFQIPYPIDDYKAMPLAYINYFLNYKGCRSLHSVLLNESLISNLSTEYLLYGEGIAEYQIKFDLTEAGLQKVNDIVTRFFEFISLFRKEGIQRWYFDEIQTIHQILFDTSHDVNTLEFVKTSSGALLEYPLKEVLFANTVPQMWQPDKIRKYLNRIRPANMRIIINDKKFELTANNTEKWMNVKYCVRDIGEDLLKEWNVASDDGKFSLPEKNVYIPDNINILPPADDNITTLYPQILRQTNSSRIWHKQDDVYLVPKTFITVKFMSPRFNSSPREMALSKLFTQLFFDAMLERTYAAYLADLSWSFTGTTNGLILAVSGLSNKMPMLIRTIFENITHFSFPDYAFKMKKEQILKELENKLSKDSHEVAYYNLHLLITAHCWSTRDLLNELRDIDEEDFKTYVIDTLKPTFREIFIYGNCDKSCAEEIANIIEAPFERHPSLYSQQLLPPRYLFLNEGMTYMFNSDAVESNNSAVCIYFQCGLESISNVAITSLFASLINGHIYDRLRVQEKLGYVVYSNANIMSGVQGIFILIQSQYEPSYLDNRIEICMEAIQDVLNDLTDEQLDAYKKSMKHTLLIKADQMAEQNQKFVYEIKRGTYEFDRFIREATQLDQITKVDLIEFYNVYMAVGAKKRTKLAIYVTPKDRTVVKRECNGGGNNTDEALYIIKDMTAFKIMHRIAPLIPPAMNLSLIGRPLAF